MGPGIFAFAAVVAMAIVSGSGVDGIPAESITPPFLKDPYLLYTGTPSEMTVHWQMEDTQQCFIEWGTDTTYGMGSSQTTEYTADHMHIHTITGLTPGTKYYYRVSCSGVYLPGNFYSAPSASATDLSFMAYGDTRTAYMTHDSVVSLMVDQYTTDPQLQSFFFHTGDLVSHGDEEYCWQNQFFNDEQVNLRQFMREVPLVACLGNHELYSYSGYNLDTPLFGKYLPYPYVDRRYWSLDYGPAHIVVADHYPDYYEPFEPGIISAEQLAWMESDLAATSKPWKFVIIHEPGWSCGGHDNNQDVQQLLQPLCETYGVQLVLTGHNHYYARACKNGVHHVTTGGGGAPPRSPQPGWPNVVTGQRAYHFCRIEIEQDQLCLSTVALRGAVIDSFCIDRSVPVSYLLGSVKLNGGWGQVLDVLVEADGSSTHPDTIGYYGMMLDPGTYTVTASLDGYQTQVFDEMEIVEGTETTLDIEMDPTSVEGEEERPGNVLHPPVPTPFTRSAAVRFELEEASDVQLEVYDVSGRIARLLVDGTMAAGEHSVLLDASGMDPGIYLVRLRFGGGEAVEKCLLVR